MNSSDSPRERAQTSPLGIALIVGITITAAVMIVFVGSAALETTQDESRIGQAEQAMTQFDSMASKVALGDSKSQNVRIGQRGGNYRVDEDAGSVKIIHEDWDGEGSTETIYEEQSLGAVVYTRGDTEIAYQGGGVWRKDGSGASTLVSPPEFHYRQATLTFPIVRVSGDGSTGGQTNARVTRVETASGIFPDSDQDYEGNSDRYYHNPIQDGNMTVAITSEYCEAWRTYLSDRTEGDVTECEDGTVEAALVTLGAQGGFDIIGGSDLPIRGQDGMSSFEVTLRPQDSEASGFNNLGWSISATEGDQEFELSIQEYEGGEPDDVVKVSVYYSDDGGESYDSWVNDQDFVIEEDGDSVKVTVDFLAVHDTRFEDIGQPDVIEHDPQQGTINSDSPSELDEPDEMGNIVQYYFNEIGDMDMETHEQSNANLGDSSSGHIEYEGGGEVVTFLHVTENEVRVELSN